MKNKKNKVLLIDGLSLLYRAYYGSISLLKRHSVFSTNAVFTIIRMLDKFLKFNNEYLKIFVFFDKGKQTIRHKEFKDYKSKRPKTPENLIKQISLFKEFLKYSEIEFFENPKYEADDLICSMVKICFNNNYFADIISSDKDLLQLINTKTSLLLPIKGIKNIKRINNKNFFENFFIKPFQIPDFKGLVGDMSDNLPGIKGIGPKKAIKLLTKYKTLENIYINIDEIDEKTKKLLVEQKKNAIFSKKMVILKKDINLNITFNYKKYDFFSYKLEPFYIKYEMVTLLKIIKSKNQKNFFF